MPDQSKPPRTLIDELIAEQRSLTAVAKFARAHEQHELPAQARHYRDLIPLSKPQSGQQYAFEVDLDKCSGCKACVTACHSLNGLDDEETWRNVGLLHGGTHLQPIQQTVTTACHHCVDPGCLNGCPVLAYEKDSTTGIVKHLDDQCIGCQYCVLKCPYDVPKYSERLGIVRKCDLCSSRLASGEAPACVQACPNEAIKITVLDKVSVRERYRGKTAGGQMRKWESGTEAPSHPPTFPPAHFLPGSPAPSITLPTTRYTSAQPLHETLRPADLNELKPQCAHTPLGIMLVLSQLSVGAFTIDRILSVLPNDPAATTRPVLTLLALLTGLLALASSTLHLGRPLGAWRAFLGLRKSWLSREIIVFGLFAKLALLYTGAIWFPQFASPTLTATLGCATVASGLLGVFCSAMIYHDTRRDFWHLRWSGLKFLGTTALLGTATVLLISSATPLPGGILTTLAGLTALFGLLKLATELPILRSLQVEDYSPLHKTALLLTGPFGRLHRIRVVLGWIGGVALPAMLGAQLSVAGSTALLVIQTAAIVLLCLAGELIERRLFFTAVQPVQMPGGVPA